MTLDQQQQTMRAVRIHETGGPEVLRLEDVEMPEPQADELLVRIAATSVNPVDYKIRNGSFRNMAAIAIPAILGRDFAGTVELAGSPSFMLRKGDKVYGMPAFDRGTYAEYIVVRANEVARMPKSLEPELAAAVPLCALTAWQGLFDHGGLSSGQNVLIHAGAGGVGHMAIQFAKNAGAKVYTTASAANLDFVKTLGADIAIDYKSQRFEDEAQNMDVVLDLVGGEILSRSFACVKQGGRLVSALAEPDATMSVEHKITGKWYMAHPSAHQLDEIADLIDHGKVRVEIGKIFSIQDIGEAHRLIEQGGFRGKIAIRV